MKRLFNLTKTILISALLFLSICNIACAENLSMIDKDGLPIPQQAKQFGLGSGLFRKVAHFDVEAPMDSVVALYTAEFSKRGWKAEPAEVSVDHQVIRFATPQGSGVLDIINSGYSIVELIVTDEVAAAKSALAPKAGMVTVLFKNETKKAVTVSLGGKRIKVVAGAGSTFKKEAGLEVAPGKLKAKTKRGSEDFVAKAGEIWVVEISDVSIFSSKQN